MTPAFRHPQLKDTCDQLVKLYYKRKGYKRIMYYDKLFSILRSDRLTGDDVWAVISHPLIPAIVGFLGMCYDDVTLYHIVRILSQLNCAFATVQFKTGDGDWLKVVAKEIFLHDGVSQLKKLLPKFMKRHITDDLNITFGSLGALVAGMILLGDAQLQSCAQSTVPVYLFRIYAQSMKDIGSKETYALWSSFVVFTPWSLLLGCVGEKSTEYCQGTRLPFIPAIPIYW